MNKKIKIAINGFGRIGRAFLKIAWDKPEIEIVAINDLGSVENLIYLLKYDSVYDRWEKDVEIKKDSILINGKEIKFLTEKDTTKLPWKELGVDVVVESTGIFTSYEKSKFHLEQGAKKVVISGPSKDDKAKTILMSINEDSLDTCDISSNGSCTTNATSPLISILNEKIGIEKAMLNTVHGYTSTQSLVDSPCESDFRRGRAAAQNIVPSSTGAAIAITKALPEFEEKFDGIACRVPVISGSMVDITFIAKKDTSVEEVNDILKEAANDKKWEKILAVTEEPLVSSDILKEPYASLVDLKMTRVVDGNLVKVMAWYDNEMGYTFTLVDHVIKTGENIK
ncbi:MAG: type I glyceraldehyde-3-phosphate dehydrogenase [Patescibacteria group bacterium]|nr:type I glyceraldehyde-3-phosphate dehydrogenase [Patescibacteria group bacterium]